MRMRRKMREEEEWVSDGLGEGSDSSESEQLGSEEDEKLDDVEDAEDGGIGSYGCMHEPACGLPDASAYQPQVMMEP